MKIGILTFWGVPNYGAFAQAYALQRTIEKIYGEGNEVKQVAYLDSKHKSMYYGIVPKGYKYSLLRLGFYKTIFNNIKNRKARNKTEEIFAKAYNEIPHVNCMCTQKLENEKFDVFYTGSDIIWDYNIAALGNDKHLFTVGIDSNRKYSYAASFGTVQKEDESPQYVVDGLNMYNAISVRDKKSAEIVENIVEKEASVVLDPTLIWNFKSDENVIPAKYNNYLLVYGSFFPEQYKNKLKEYAKEHKKKIVGLDSGGDDNSWCDIEIKQDELSPMEWIGLFKGADTVMTCTYHGLMFSIIFEKRIIFHATDFMKNKATDLLEKIGLYEVLMSDETSFEKMISYHWNYNVISKKLDDMKKESLNYLKMTKEDAIKQRR